MNAKNKLKLKKVKITSLDRKQLQIIQGGDGHILGPKNKTRPTREE
ncbi:MULTISPECIES: hypothetical protein [Aquimarina]|nr:MULTISPECIES: hypothetical protein [Aquimarina]